MTRTQRETARDRARTAPPANCKHCGIHVDAIPMWAALEVYEGDELEAVLGRESLSMLLVHTGCSAMVSFCPSCVSFASIALDGTPCDVTVTL